MFLNNKKRNGFTLIEAIIYVAIFVIIATLGAAVFDFALKNKRVNGRASEVYSVVNRAMQQMVDRVHAASYIVSASGNTLVLWMSDNTSTTFSLASNAVTQKDGTSATVSITPSTVVINNLSFSLLQNTSATSTKISISGEYNDNGTPDTTTLYTLQTSALPL